MTPRLFFCTALFAWSILTPRLSAQEGKKAAVFREHKAPTLNLIRPSDESYELWENFMLMQKANNGEAAAQHELGVRYFIGRGFGLDTTKAAYWIQKAADQNFMIARYNIAVFLNNGWGAPWNPYKAFEQFQYAAQQGMPEAEYVYGSLLTDNLVVQQDWNEAFRWIRKSADAGYQPAKDALIEFEKRGFSVHADSAGSRGKQAPLADSSLVISQHSLKPVLLDFGEENAADQDELSFLKEMLKKGSPELKNALGISKLDADKLVADSTLVRLIQDAAEVGSPEALAVLGRFREKGIAVRKNLIAAAIEYLRAVRLEFPRAPALLLHLVQDKKFLQQVHTLARQGSADAEFVCAGLVSVGLDVELPPQEATQLLKNSAAQHHTQALIELGLCYYSGRGVELDKQKAAELWLEAALLGSREAQIRLTAMKVIGNTTSEEYGEMIRTLDTASRKGSLLAEVALAHCYETGRGVALDTAEAVRLYRQSTYRGSQIAYYALKKMYDDQRPDSPKFRIKED